jgi:hypothetical protein
MVAELGYCDLRGFVTNSSRKLKASSSVIDPFRHIRIQNAYEEVDVCNNTPLCLVGSDGREFLSTESDGRDRFLFEPNTLSFSMTRFGEMDATDVNVLYRSFNSRWSLTRQW